MPNHIPIAAGTLTLASVALTTAVVGNAYYQKRQFYPSVVYITKSNPSMAAIYLMAFTMVLLLGKLLKKIFFGQLRAAELEQLVERSFYAVTETCLAFTVFRDDFSPKFVALFTVLLFLKAFHYLLESRVDFMERSPSISNIFHLRVISLLICLCLLDAALVFYSYHSTVTHGPSVQIVFGFEYAILLTAAFYIFVKYACHSVDLHLENPWDNKALYLLFTELIVGLLKVILYAIFLFIMMRIHTFPLFIIRPMYLSLRSFKNALNGVIQSRRAIHNMNTFYPDATTEELSSVDNVCIICREEMNAGAKKLPCGHIFHTSCLRSWFQRQQTCPTCRMDILRQNPTPSQDGQQQNQQQNQNQANNQPPQQPQAQLNPQNIFAGFAPGILPPPFPFPPMPMQQPAAQASAESTEGSTSQPKPGEHAAFSPPTFPIFPMPIPMPSPPQNLGALSIEELRRIEGNERSHLEARIQALRDIRTLLDAASLQLSQYTSVVDSLPSLSDTSVKAEGKDESVKTEDMSGNDTLVKEEGAAALDPEDTNELRRRRLQRFEETT